MEFYLEFLFVLVAVILPLVLVMFGSLYLLDHVLGMEHLAAWYFAIHIFITIPLLIWYVATVFGDGV